jgi:hypothetical protein
MNQNQEFMDPEQAYYAQKEAQEHRQHESEYGEQVPEEYSPLYEEEQGLPTQGEKLRPPLQRKKKLLWIIVGLGVPLTLAFCAMGAFITTMVRQSSFDSPHKVLSGAHFTLPVHSYHVTDGPQIIVNDAYGDINIHTTDVNNITVHPIANGMNEKTLNNSVHVLQKGNVITITVDPNAHNNVDVDITTPENSNINASD